MNSNSRPTNWRAVFGIIRKDLRVVAQSKSVVLPMAIIPLLFFVIAPIGMAVSLNFFSDSIEKSGDFAEIMQMVPTFLREQYPGYSVVQIGGLFMLRYMFAT
jgi:hypothetical protein